MRKVQERGNELATVLISTYLYDLGIHTFSKVLASTSAFSCNQTDIIFDCVVLKRSVFVVLFLYAIPLQ